MTTKKLPSNYRMIVPTTTVERSFLTNLIKAHIRVLCLYVESEFGQRNEAWKCYTMGEDGYAKLTANVDLSRSYHAIPVKDRSNILRLRAFMTFTCGELDFWVEDDKGCRASLEEYIRELVDAPYCPFEAEF